MIQHLWAGKVGHLASFPARVGFDLLLLMPVVRAYKEERIVETDLSQWEQCSGSEVQHALPDLPKRVSQSWQRTDQKNVPKVSGIQKSCHKAAKGHVAM